jgi:2-hydroxy-3-oxopropionate reductase
VGALSQPDVAVVGLGLMGRPIARTLIAAGFAVRGWNRSPLAPEDTAGIGVVESESEIASADIVVLVLADSEATGEVFARLMPALRSGTVVVDMGSSEPADSRHRASRLAPRGIGWVDAPVSGGPEAAAGGALAIMAGGESEHVARVRPVLDALGVSVTHVGGPGAGHTMKIVNQVIVGLTIETVAEALALAERAGFVVEQVQEAVRGGSADNAQLRVQGSRMAAGDWTPGARVRTMLKDLRMAERLASEHGLVLPQLTAAILQYDALVARGDEGKDVAVLVDLHR